MLCLDDLRSMNDTQLLKEYSKGNEQAFSTLESRYRHCLFSFINRIILDKNLSDDCYQNTWVNFLRYQHTMRPDVPVLSYLFATAQAMSVEVCRKTQRRIKILRSSQYKQHMDQVNRIQVPKHNLEESQVGLVTRVLGNMEGISQEILILRYYLGYNYKELAAILGIPMGTVKSRLHSAHKCFAKKYKGTNNV